MEANERRPREGEENDNRLRYRRPWTLRANRHPASDAWRPCDRGVLGTIEANRRG